MTFLARAHITPFRRWPRGAGRIVLLACAAVLSTADRAVGQTDEAVWRPTNGPMSAHVSAIEIDENQGVYAGTFREGIFHTADHGDSWRRLGLEGTDIRAIVREPGGGLLVGTFGDGVYRSWDGGESWRELNLGLDDLRVQTMVRDGTGVILAGTNGSGVYALDEGVEWRHASEGLTDPDVRAMSIGSDGIAYAACRRDGVFESSDYGRTWIPFEGGSPLGILRAIATRGKMVVAGGWLGGVARTYRGEGAWERIADGLPNQKVWSLSVTAGGEILAGMHGHGMYRYDESASAWIPMGLDGDVVTAVRNGQSGDIWIGTRTGIYVSDEPGAGWHLIGVPRSYVYGLAATETGVLIAATYESGLLQSEDLGERWVPSSLHFEDVYSVAADGSRLFAGGIVGRVFVSSDAGRSWTVVNKDPSDEWTRQPISSLGVDGDRVIAGSAGDGVLLSSDGGISWRRAGLGGETVWAVAVDSGHDVYAGTGSGLYRSASGDEPWEQIAGEGIRQAGVYTVLPDPAEGILIGTGDGVFLSGTGGTDFEPAGLQGKLVATLVRGGDGVLYAGTFGNGVFARTSIDTLWAPKHSGLENLFVRALAYVRGADADRLFAATNGDGVFWLEIPATPTADVPGEALSFTLDQNYPNPFSGTTRISFSTPRAGAVRLAVYDIRGQLLRIVLSGVYPPGRSELTWRAGDLSAGVYYYSLETERGRITRPFVVVR